MAFPQNIPVSSIQALTSTVRSDFYVYRWFKYLILQSSLREHLPDADDTQRLYRRLQRTTLLQDLMVASIVVLGGAWYLAPHGGILVLLLFSLMAAYRLFRADKEIVSQMVAGMLGQDFAESELSQRTLYQISEWYASRHKIPSLIDKMYRADDACRKIICLIILFDAIIYVFIFQFNVWKNLAFLVGLYYAVFFLIHSPFLYKHLR